MSQRSWPGQDFSVAKEYFLCRDRVSNGREALCRDKIGYVTTECGQMERFCVATEQFYVAT